MIRKKAARLISSNQIKWRSNEPSRLETFSDAVFGFALTLIIVSIEVPKTFDDLVETMKGTLSFAACFALLFQIWNNQNVFFRRYGLKDPLTNLLNAILLFVVLIYAYPLKFLTVLLFSDGQILHNGHMVDMIRDDQVKALLLVYGAGFVAIYLLFYLMYRNAAKHAAEIELNPRELYETNTVSGINLICILICLCAMVLTYLSPMELAGKTGFIYFLIPAGYFVWYSYRGKQSRKLFGN
ncbi:putative membrane protein [Mucilaginibacter sp. UYP25]|uniref:TMEM175 family protein n=1 Tax=unclassified Mucilaginibacter TaxID=2617802 RepID=UPI00339A6F96